MEVESQTFFRIVVLPALPRPPADDENAKVPIFLPDIDIYSTLDILL
jgi:hypothetical protein